MDTATLQVGILDGLMGIPVDVCFFLLFRKSFLFSFRTTVICYALFVLASFSFGFVLGDASWYMVLCTLMNYGLYLLFLRRDRICCCILLTLYSVLMNLLMSLFTGMILGGYALITGASVWPALDRSAPYYSLLFAVVFIPSIFIAYRIIIIFKDDIDEIRGAGRVLLVLLIPVFTCVSVVIKFLTTDIVDYRNQPGGIGYILDVMAFVFTFIGMIIILHHHLKKTRGRFLQTQAKQAEEDNAYREDVTQLQMSLRQARHDAAGWKQHQRKDS